MTARVLFVGLDATEATLVDRWRSEGLLPGFEALERQAATTSLSNPLDTLPGGIWPEIWSGRSTGQVPLYFHPGQLHTGEARPRPVAVDEVDPRLQFWATASEAGKRVAALDIPQAVPVPGLDGIQLFEWALHDRQFAVSSDPPELLQGILDRWGPHPVRSCDHHGETDDGYERLLDGLLAGARAEREVLTGLLESEDWDLFACGLAESHCVGHQFMHFLDPATLRYRTEAPAHLRDAILSVYQELDQTVGELVSKAGEASTVVVICSHGMGPYIGGYQLLAPLLRRMGLAPGGPPLPGPRARATRAVRGLSRRARRIVGRRPASRHPFEVTGTRAASLPNNRCGAIRLNLIGREPNGTVQPGAEADALLAELRQTIGDLRHPASGELIVRSVATATETYGPDHHPDVPDLTVAFRRDLGPLESAWSERYGLIEKPIYQPNLPRTGDHTDETRLWVLGPGVEPGGKLPEGSVLDVAPTVLGLLGVDPPTDLDGSALSLSAG